MLSCSFNVPTFPLPSHLLILLPFCVYCHVFVYCCVHLYCCSRLLLPCALCVLKNATG